MVRTPRFDKNGMKKGSWSPEEDSKLIAYIQRYGHWNWRELPKFAGLARCGKSCRLRWINYLRPNVKRGNYTKEEEDVIVKLHEDLGNKWSIIAKQLAGRTDNEIKNYWHTHLKKRAKQNKPTKIEAQSADIFQSEADKNIESAPKNVADIDPSPHPILESSEPVPEPSSSEMSYDYAVVNGTEDGISSFECFSKPIEDFWSKPFLADTSYNQINDFSSTLVEIEFLPPYDLYCDGGMDFLYQQVKEFA